MTDRPADDGSLWPVPEESARTRQLKVLLIVVGVIIVLAVVLLQLIDYVDPQTTTNHAQGGIHAMSLRGDGSPV